MLEIIKRTEGELSQKEQITGENVQIAYNSWGHLSIRVIQRQQEGEATKDVLVVLDGNTSNEMIEFCRHIKPIGCHVPNSEDDLPF